MEVPIYARGGEPTSVLMGEGRALALAAACAGRSRSARRWRRRRPRAGRPLAGGAHQLLHLLLGLLLLLDLLEDGKLRRGEHALRLGDGVVGHPRIAAAVD